MLENQLYNGRDLCFCHCSLPRDQKRAQRVVGAQGMHMRKVPGLVLGQSGLLRGGSIVAGDPERWNGLE